MTNNLPDRDTLAQVIAQAHFFARYSGDSKEDAARSAADAVLNHLRATSPPPTPGQPETAE